MGTIDNTASGKITAAGTAQAVSAANAARTYWLLQNTSAAGKLVVGIGAAVGANAGGGVVLGPGDLTDSAVVPELTQAALYVAGEEVGAAFTFVEVVSST